MSFQGAPRLFLNLLARIGLRKVADQLSWGGRRFFGVCDAFGLLGFT